jgi:hypothetical protein
VLDLTVIVAVAQCQLELFEQVLLKRSTPLLSWNSFRTLSTTLCSCTNKFTLIIVFLCGLQSQPHCYCGVTFGVASQSQLELCSHYNIFEVTFAVTLQSQKHSCSPYSIFGVIFAVASQSLQHLWSHLCSRLPVTAGTAQSLQHFWSHLRSRVAVTAALPQSL